MKSLHSQNFYEVLGVSRYASTEEIRNAYDLSRRTFVQETMATYSLLSDEEQQEILDLVSLAYQTLLSPQTRREYDSFLNTGVPITRDTWNVWRKPRDAQAPPRTDKSHEDTRQSPDQDLSAPQSKAQPAGRPPPAASLKLQPPPGQSRPQHPQSAVRTERALDSSATTTAASSAENRTRQPSGVRGVPQRKVSPPPEPKAAPDTPPLEKERVRQNVAAVAIPSNDGHGKDSAPGVDLERFVEGVQQFNGQILRRARELANLSLRDICERTKIRQTYVEYIEAENYDGLPAPVYVKGFVRILANALNLPQERVVQDYIARYEQHARPTSPNS